LGDKVVKKDSSIKDVVVSAESCSDNDNNSVGELEKRAQALGYDLEAQKEAWKKKGKKMGWRLSVEGWRKWLRRLCSDDSELLVKPAVPRREDQQPMPSRWPAFMQENYQKSQHDPETAYAMARQKYPDMIQHFQRWDHTQTK